MKKYQLIISYDGTAYVGWQTQPNGVSVQSRVQTALQRILGEQNKVTASGRTDAGVHALALSAHFVTGSNILPEKIKSGLNSLLPEDISVSAVRRVPMSFHAQRSAVGKIYKYLVLSSSHRCALLRLRCWQMRDPLDIQGMSEATACLVGTHDFEAFRAAGCRRKDAVCTIDSVRVRKIPVGRWHSGGGDLVELTFRGHSFARHMIRNIVGTLVDVGRGRLPKEDLKAVLLSKSRARAGKCAPPFGLYLVKVIY